MLWMEGLGPACCTKLPGKSYIYIYILYERLTAIGRRRDLRLVELAVKKGADVFVRDKRNKRVLDGEKNADDRIKMFLRQCKFSPRA